MLSWLPWVRRRRRRLRHTPLPPEWTSIIDRNVPLVALLVDDRQRRTMNGMIQLFLYDKAFEGCGGLTMSDEIRVTIASQACLLLANRPVEWPYPLLDVVRVYPSSYVAPTRDWVDGGFIREGDSHRLGESSARGFIVLSWDDALRGGRDPYDGQNVVLHEFAHQLDAESGSTNGAPILGEPGLYAPWARVLGSAYADLERDIAARRSLSLDPYGVTNPAEFFAVATEAFFERPAKLRRDEPALYEVLARYYRFSPV